jgi:trans-2,3-dihydro-3-hydroxyanthranilate isomerase
MVEPVPDDIALAECASLTRADLLHANHSPVMAGVGLAFAIAEVRDLETLARAKPVTSVFETASNRLPGLPGGLALFLYTRLDDQTDTVQARMFAPLDNVPEDPATGSASAALGGLLAHLRPERDLTHRLTIRQGFEMGRPSTINQAGRNRLPG